MDVVHDYFPDHLLDVHETSSHCHLGLQRSNYDYCEDLGGGLRWLDINVGDIRDFHVSGAQSFLCLLESWIPYGWSIFLANNQNRASRAAVVHLDDHTDMMSPKIGLYGEDWKDMLTHSAIDMCSPKTMKQAVLSGAITLGSMMTPLLHHLDQVDVFHLAYGGSAASMRLDRTTIDDDLLEPGRQRMAVDISNSIDPTRHDGCRYLRTPEISEIAKAIPKTADILLHIDMDYFNNRYNGSDEWKDHPARHDKPLRLQKEEMARICESFVGAGLVERVRHVSIGISPSFYPSEFWEDAMIFLLHGLVASGMPVSDLLEYVQTRCRKQA